MTAPSITSGRASGSSPRAIGARARCSWWRFPPTTRSTTISSPIGGRTMPIKSGDALSFDYRLYWQDSEPNYPKNIARAVATRIGRGGMPGQNPWPANKRKFVIDWQGGTLDQLQQRYDVTPVINCLQRQGRRRLCHQGGGHRSLARAVRRHRRRQEPDRSALLSQAGRQDAHARPGFISISRKAELAGNAAARCCCTDSEF